MMLNTCIVKNHTQHRQKAGCSVGYLKNGHIAHEQVKMIVTKNYHIYDICEQVPEVKC